MSLNFVKHASANSLALVAAKVINHREKRKDREERQNKRNKTNKTVKTDWGV
jgi:hypothetical protein